MTTTTSINTNNNIIIVPGVGTISASAYAKMYATFRTFWSKRDQMFGCEWDYNPYFIPVVYSWLKAKGDSRAEMLKEISLGMIWNFRIIDGQAHLESVQYTPINEFPSVEIKEEGKEDISLSSEKYMWEAIRDLCFPVVMQYV